jgi:hypothetical protein
MGCYVWEVCTGRNVSLPPPAAESNKVLHKASIRLPSARRVAHQENKSSLLLSFKKEESSFSEEKEAKRL